MCACLFSYYCSTIFYFFSFLASSAKNNKIVALYRQCSSAWISAIASPSCSLREPCIDLIKICCLFLMFLRMSVHLRLLRNVYNLHLAFDGKLQHVYGCLGSVSFHNFCFTAIASSDCKIILQSIKLKQVLYYILVELLKAYFRLQ